MSLETRSSLFKRAEQLKRWEESETNREPTVPNRRTKKIQFSPGIIFLAACASGDKEEVLRLLKQGIDIDTTNVDGLTALHQLCIDNNLELVEFLVEHGANVNRGDNEGWTPLHAIASCGFISIAKYLIEHGGNVAAVNNDGELPVDLAESDEMEDLLQSILTSKGIDCEEARNEEERMMLTDAKQWLDSGEAADRPHPKTGATALHVASAKGYIKVMSILLQAGSDVNIQDFDGWTPLHAAAHWGQKEACELLSEGMCDMEVKNCVGQTPFDVADMEVVPVLEELRAKQATIQRDRGEANAILARKGAPTQKRRMSVTEKSSLINKDASSERQAMDRSTSEEGSNKMAKVELEIKTEPRNSTAQVEKKNRVNRDETSRISLSPQVNKTVPNMPPSSPPATPTENDDSSVASWRRQGSYRARGANGRDEPSNKTLSLTPRIGEKESPKATTPTGIGNSITENAEVVLRRTQSFEADEKFYRRYLELQARIKAGSCPTLHHSTPASALPTRSASLREKQLSRLTSRGEDGKLNLNISAAQEPPSTTASVTTTTATTTVTTSPSKVSTTMPTATSPLPTSQVRRSFVPPVRDEESETQRKAHAKRVRETRRSTQGVTLEEIKSAEQLVKKKNQQQLHEATQQLNNSDQSPIIIPTTNCASVTATITTATPTVAGSGGGGSGPVGAKEEEAGHERRPSWRLRVDNGDRNKFLLEDARNRSTVSEPPSTYVRRPMPTTQPARPASAPVETAPADATVTIALRRQAKPPDDKDQDKENDIRNAQATQAVIQRRRRPKRRSTGVVHVDMDEIDPERQESPGRGDTDVTKVNDEESGGDWSGPSSRLSSSPAGGDTLANSRPAKETSENGEIDYKKLYEASMLDNERLREKLKKTEDDLSEAKSLIDKGPVGPMKNSLSDMEKRERRAMERKLSEMEEELKLLEQFKNENQRLKDENGALIRVISKLSK